MRTIDELIESSQKTIRDACVLAGGWNIEPLFSGGHDSLVATHIASQFAFQHPRLAIPFRVHHIDTGIGAAYTRRFVESVCDTQGWRLKVHKSSKSFEQYVSEFGFPGPGLHGQTFNTLKDRCLYYITKACKNPSVLVNGARRMESVRRMGKVSRIVQGDGFDEDGKMINRKRIWTAVCHDWTTAEQQLYMDEFGLPTNRLKIAVGLSGECFCGAFAQPGEIELIRKHAPDVGQEIDRLTVIAKQNNRPCVWGQRPDGPVVVAETGPMCSSCDQRAMASGLVVIERKGA